MIAIKIILGGGNVFWNEVLDPQKKLRQSITEYCKHY